MPRYPKQDFQQNISFKCTMEFRFALKLAMEKTGSRDLSSFIRDHLTPAIQRHLTKDELAGLVELNSPVRLKEAVRSHFRYRATRITEAIGQLLAGAPPTPERRAVEMLRQLQAYEAECSRVFEDTKAPALLRAAVAPLVTELGKLIKLISKPWSQALYIEALKIAADLPEALSLDVGNGLDFLNDDSPSRDKPYARNRAFHEVWKKVAQAVAEERKTEAVLIHALEFSHCEVDTFFVAVPDNQIDKLAWLNTPRNTNLFLSKIEAEIGRPAQIRFSRRTDLPF